MNGLGHESPDKDYVTNDDIWIYTEGEDEGGNNRCYSDAPTEIIANDLDDKDPLVTVDID